MWLLRLLLLAHLFKLNIKLAEVLECRLHFDNLGLNGGCRDCS